MVVSDNKFVFSNWEIRCSMDWENLLDYIFSSLFAQHKVAKIFTMALEKDNSNPDLKSSFRSRNIQFFVFLSFTLFLPVGHCFGVWSKTNFKVHDVIIFQVQKNPFISYVLSEQDWWCNIKWFLIYSKNYICKFMQAKLWHKLFHFNLPFWIWKVWKGRRKVTKMWISRSFLDEIENIFHSFWRSIIWWKNKNLMKNSLHRRSSYCSLLE